MSVLVFHMFERAPRAVAPYSHAVEADGWVFLTGQIPEHPDDPERSVPEGIEAQTRRTMDNLAIVLTHFERDYQAMNAVYRSYFADGRLPARTCIGVTALAHGVLVEIDFIARRPD